MAKKKTALAAALNKKKNKQKAVQKKQKTQQKPKETSRVASAKKAVEKGQQKSALGTKVEKKTETAKVKTADGKTKKVKYSYQNMTMQDYGKMEVGARTGQLQKTLQTDKKLNKKVADLNVKDYAKSPGVMGALDQMTQGLSVSEDPVFNYSKSQDKIVKSQKQTGKYNVGRAIGAIGEFALGGTGTVGSALTKNAGKTLIGRAVKTAGKEALEEAAEQSGKKLAKETIKNAAKETLADAGASAGLNILDSVKDSYKDGKLDSKTFWKSLGLNTLGDIAIGGVVSGVTHSLSAVQASNFNKIVKKLQKGENISEAERKFFNKHEKEIREKVEAKLKQETEQQATKPSDAVDNSVKNTKAKSVKELETEKARLQSLSEDPKYSSDLPQINKRLDEVQSQINALNIGKAEKPTISKTETVEPTVAKSATTETPKVENKHLEELRAHSEELSRQIKDETDYYYKIDGGTAVDIAKKSIDKLKAEKRAIDDEILSIEKDNLAVKTKSDSLDKQLKEVIDEMDAELENTNERAFITASVDEMRKAGATDDEILEYLEKQGVNPYEAMQAIDGNVDLKFKEEIKKANNNVSFEDYMKDELKLVELKKEYSQLKYKAENTTNPDHYRQYVQRRTEIADILDEIAERRKVENVAIPQKKTVTEAEDLTGAARGAYKEDLQTLTRGNRRGLDNLYRIFVDTFHGFEQYAKELPKEAREAFRAQINAARNAKNKAGGWLSEARIDASGKKVGSSFNDIMGDMLNPKNAKKYEEFQYYLANKHNIDRYPEGKGVFGDEITDTDSRAICAKLESEYDDFAKIQDELSKYFKDLQQYRVDTGLVSKSTAEYLDALYPNYVPTYRVVDGQRVRVADKPNTTIEMGDVIKEAKGSNAEMLPLHEQVANLTEYTMKMGEQNRLFNVIATTQGIKVDAIDPSVRLDDLVDACTFTNKTTDGATNKFFVAFYENGWPRKIEISEQMYLGIREWRNDPDSLASMLNWKAKHIRGANALFKNLITGWNPIFGVKNIIKDTGEALIYSKNTKGFIRSYPKAIASIVNKKSDYAKYFDLYQASGGKYAHIREDISTFKTDSTFKKIAKAPLEVCQRFNDCLEAIPRMAEFISTIDNSLDVKKMLQAGKSIDDVLKKMDTNTINKALYNANEVTLNFGRSGVAGKALNSTVIPYLNPAIQGLDKLRRVFVDAGTDGIKGWLGLAGKISAFAITPAMFNEVMMTFFGGEAYQILNTRDKDNNYFIPIEDGKFIKIPKARVSSALASLFEHLYRHAVYGDPMEWKQMFSTAWSNVGVMNPIESSLFSPIGLVLANKTWYGGSIENASDLDLRATGERSKIYDETTSAISIWIGDKLNMSPKKIDYIIDAYTGSIGDILLPMTAEASSGNPLYKNFILDSVFSNKLSTSFWDKNANLEAYSNAKGGEYSEKHEEWKAEYMYDALTINQAIHDIDSDKNLTKKQKLEMKRELRKGLNKYYAAGTNGTKINLEPVSFIAKQIGADKALRKYLPDNENKQYSFKEHYESFKALEGYSSGSKADKNKIANQFLKTYKLAVETQKQIDVENHNRPDWTTIAISNVLTKTSDNISIACGVYKDTLDEAKTYVKYNGDTKKYITTQKRINKIVDKIEKQGTDVSSNIYKKYLKSGISALALASSSISFKDRAYYITGTDGKMNASRGLMSKYNWNIAEVVKLGFSADSDGNTYLKKQEVINAIESSKAKTAEEKAILFNIIYGDSGSNPYGSIGDYSINGDTGITKTRSTASGGSGGYRRGGGSSKKSSVPSWENYVKDYITSAEKSSGVNFKDWDSPIDKTYQNKTKAIRKKMEV